MAEKVLGFLQDTQLTETKLYTVTLLDKQGNVVERWRHLTGWVIEGSFLITWDEAHGRMGHRIPEATTLIQTTEETSGGLPAESAASSTQDQAANSKEEEGE